MKRNAQDAFTLVEMAMVVAIIGLIIGGIIAGQSVIASERAASVGRDLTQYGSAVDQFRTRFRAWPGDMANAVQYWGTDPDGCPTHTNRIPKTTTCNGNGDQQIGPTGQEPERFRAWQQLADAGLVNGQYTGVAGSGGTDHVVAPANSPAWRAALGGYSMLVSSAAFPTMQNVNAILFGKTNATTINSTPIIPPDAAAMIDTKYDDGKPGFGIMQQWPSNIVANCVTSFTDTTALYQLTQPGDTCEMLYRLPRQSQ